MWKLGVVLTIGTALAACAPGDTWSSRVVEEPYMPPAPQHLLRRPADFRITDPHVRKEFFLYMYEDESISEQVVTVINYSVPEASRNQRLATREETDYAMALFIADWRSKGQDERLQYFNRRLDEEQYRKATQYDDLIEHKKEEKKWWDTQAFNLEADLISRQNTGSFAGGDEKLNLADTPSAQKQLAHAKRMAALAEVQLAILEYKRAMRDSQYARAGATFIDSTLPVQDLIPMFSTPMRLIDDIRQHVQPFAWSLSEVRISIAEGQLTVRHTRDVVLMVRDYVDELRAQFLAKAREKQLVEPPKPAAPQK